MITERSTDNKYPASLTGQRTGKDGRVLAIQVGKKHFKFTEAVRDTVSQLKDKTGKYPGR